MVYLSGVRMLHFVFALVSCIIRSVSPDEGSSLTEHSDTKTLPLPLMDPHLLGGVQTRQHCSPFPRYQPRIHVLKHMHIDILASMNTSHNVCDHWSHAVNLPCTMTIYNIYQVTLGRVITSTLSTSLLNEGGILLMMRWSRNSWAPWNMSPPPTIRMELYILRFVSSDAVQKNRRIKQDFLSTVKYLKHKHFILSELFPESSFKFLWITHFLLSSHYVLSFLTTAIDTVQNCFIQPQCFALKLAHDGGLPREVSRRGLFHLSCTHQALALSRSKVHIALHPSSSATTPTSPGQIWEVSHASLTAHVTIQTSTWSANSLPFCRGFGGLLVEIREWAKKTKQREMRHVRHVCVCYLVLFVLCGQQVVFIVRIFWVALGTVLQWWHLLAYNAKCGGVEKTHGCLTGACRQTHKTE